MRLWTSAYGLQSNVAGIGDFHQSNGVIVIDSIDGKWWHHVTSLVSGTSQRTSHRMINAAAQGPFFARGRFRLGTLPASANRIFRWSAGGIPLFGAITATGNIQLSDETGLIGTSATALSAGTYVIECEFDSHLGAGACVAILRINGVAEVTATNRTFTSTTVQQFDVGGNLNSETQTVGDWRWTDIAINDSTTSVQNSWPGNTGEVAYLFPISNGDANVGVTRGGTDSGADWSQLDEVPPNDATDYIEMATTSGKCWVRVTDPTSVGIGEAYHITLVHVGGRVALAAAGTGNWFPSLKSQASGTELDASPVTLAATTWSNNDDSSGLQQYKVTAYTDPQSGGAWTTAKLRTLQVGAKTTDGSPATRVSQLFAVVEYVPFSVRVPAVMPGGVYAGLQVPSGGFQ